MTKKRFRLLLGGGVLLLLILVVYFQPHQYLTLENLKSSRGEFARYVIENPVSTSIVYFLIYVASTAISLPGATVLTLAGGAVFGFFHGLVLVSFASTIGATLAFLLARFLFRDSIQKKFGGKLERINQGIEREGSFYLFTLRLVPAFPFFVINVVMGLTPIKTPTYFLVSQIGMLPGTMAYVYAGTQLGAIDSMSGILSPGLLAAFVILGALPLVARWTISFLRARKYLRGFRKPESFDYNLVVVGAGSAGLVSSYIAAAVKAKVALIEKHRMGGDCLNTGCVPSKALLRTAKMMSYIRRAEEFGIESVEPRVNFEKVMDRVHEVIKTIEPHDSVERYTGLGVDCYQGAATIRSPYEVEVNGKVLTTKNIIIATGASPFVPPIPGLREIDHLTSDSLWDLRALPERLTVLGGGPIGCEMAQAFQRLGSQVTLVEMAPRLLGREDPDVSEIIQQKFEEEGIQVLTGCKAEEVVQVGSGGKIICSSDSGSIEVEFDRVLVAIGRRANVKGFGLEELGIEVSPEGTVASDECLRTKYPNVFVCGDVAGPYQFTHTAAHQAWFAAVNALFGPFIQYRADYRVIPWTTFTDPEVAHVGLSETVARERNISYEVTRYGIDDLDRAIADGEAKGFVKVLTRPGKDSILGATIVGPHAGDLLAEYVTAMKHNLGLNKILGTIHVYPTLAEANKFAAGNWKKANAPQKLLSYVQRFHCWRRGRREPAPVGTASTNSSST